MLIAWFSSCYECANDDYRLHALFQNPDFLCENVRRGLMSAYIPINHLEAPACPYIVYGLPSPRTMYCTVMLCMTMSTSSLGTL